MPLPGFPTEADLAAFPAFKQLTGSLEQQDLYLECQGAIAAAIQEWQRRTGYYPFLVERDSDGNDVDTTRYYDPQGPEKGPVGIYAGLANMGGSRRLFLDGGILSVTTLQTGYSTEFLGVQTLTEGRDFWLSPQTASSNNLPYTYIEFRTPQYGNPRSIAVTGKFGFTNSIDAAVRRAILQGATAEAADAGVLAKFGGLKQWTEDQTSEVYGDNPNGATIMRLVQAFETAVTSSRYRKITIV